MTTPHGFLAIWCTMQAEDLADYRAWLTQEHMADRTRVPGFLSARLFASHTEPGAHFILYATEGPETLASPAYLEVLDSPSPWTRRLMPKFGGFDRAAGAQLFKRGDGFGAHVAVSRVVTDHPDPDLPALQAGLRPLLDLPEVTSVRLFAVDHGSTDIETEEKTMRQGGEGAFQYLLCAEALSRAGAEAAARLVGADLAGMIGGLVRHDSASFALIYGETAHEARTDD